MTSRRLLVPSAAFLWGLQFAFLNPALALLLVKLFHASPAEVGLVLGVYNASGFLASVVVPRYADRRHDYVRPMLVCGLLTLVLTAVLLAATSLPIAVVGLVVFGAPAGVGSTLLFAHLRFSGADPTQVLNVRALVSFAWVAGAPLATLIIGTLGNRAILLAIGAVALLNIATTAEMLSGRSTPGAAPSERSAATVTGPPLTRLGVGVLVCAFIALHAANVSAVSIMSVFVTETLHRDVVLAGVTLGVAAALEIPAMLAAGRLNRRWSSLRLIFVGCLAGIAYYAGMTWVSEPVGLIGLQLLNAWFFAALDGLGLTLFQATIPGPGLASGLFANTRRLGAIASGAVIAVSSTSVLGYRGVFASGAVLAVLALVAIGFVARTPKALGEPTSLLRG